MRYQADAQSSLFIQKFIMSNICMYRGVQVWLTGLLKCYHFIILVTVAELPGIPMQWYISSRCEEVCGPIVSIVICVHCFYVLSRNSHFFHNENILALLDWCLVVHMVCYTLNSELKGTIDSPPTTLVMDCLCPKPSWESQPHFFLTIVFHWV